MANKMFYILGAGGFAREIYSYLQPYDYKIGDYSLVGFLDDQDDALNGFNLDHSICGKLKSKAEMVQGSGLVFGVGNCLLKKSLYDYYSTLDCELLTYIHPSALVGKNVKIGSGSVLCPNSVLTTNVTLGFATTVNVCSTIGHDAVLGDFCTLSSHCDITGGAVLGDQVLLGTHACIIPKVIVRSSAIIGAGSVVIKDVAEGSTVFGNPAKKIK